MASGRVGFGDVLRVAEFRAIWIAHTQSSAGDQLARVALSVLVFQRTSSPLLTGLTYALTFLPAIVGGALLSGLADRYPRRQLMVACDLLRMVLLAAMTLTGLPIWLICGLLVISVLATSPFIAAESALVPDVLEGELYVVGTGLRSISGQLAQLAGFAGGGVVIAAVGPRAGLAIDAATFGLSAGLLHFGLRRRPAPRPVGAAGPSGVGDARYAGQLLAGLRFVLGHPRLRILLGLSWLAGLYVIPEGVAPPYAAALGAGPGAVGALMAADPAGTAFGTFLFVRYVAAERRVRWIGPLAVASGLPLLACAARPGLVPSVLLWGFGGVFAAYQVQVIAEYVRAVPDHRRGQAVGVASSGLIAVQGLGVLAGGALAGVIGSFATVALSGGVGAVLALGLALGWRQVGYSTRAREDDGRIVADATG